MTNEAFFISLPVNFKNKCQIYPPILKEMLSNENFNIFRKLLTYSQEELEDDLVNKIDSKEEIPTPLEYLLASSYFNEEFEQLAKDAFKFFIKEDVTFLYDRKAILIGNLEEVVTKINTLDDLVIIEENEQFEFQNLIRESLGEKPIEPPNPNEDPRVRRIKAKARYRDKIKAKKGMGLSLETIMESICCMGIGITPLNIGEMSYVAVTKILNRYQEKEEYRRDIDCLLAGADSKKIKPKYWIRNLE